MAFAALTVFLLHLYVAVAVLITCEEPPYPTTLCNERAESDDAYLPWSLTTFAAPALVLISAAAARHRNRAWVFNATWFLWVFLGASVFFVLRAAD